MFTGQSVVCSSLTFIPHVYGTNLSTDQPAVSVSVCFCLLNKFFQVIICDPAQRDSWPLLKMAESFIVHIAPVRVGLVFSTPPSPISGLESASVALLNAFNYVAEEKDRYAGLSFITEVSLYH